MPRRINSHKGRDGSDQAGVSSLFVKILVLCVFVSPYFILHLQIQNNDWWSAVSMATTADDAAATTTATTGDYDPNRLCEQNPYAQSLAVPLSNYSEEMRTWLENKIQIERDLNHEYVASFYFEYQYVIVVFTNTS
jgi:hypothetical protein